MHHPRRHLESAPRFPGAERQHDDDTRCQKPDHGSEQGIDRYVIQNASPGLNTKEFIALLVATAVPKLTADLAGLGVAAYTAIAATIAHDLGTLDAGGNQGNVNTTPSA